MKAVLLRGGLNYIYWHEEQCNGVLGTVLVNMRTIHNAGMGIHCAPEGISMGPVGAHGRYAGKYDVARSGQIKS